VSKNISFTPELENYLNKNSIENLVLKELRKFSFIELGDVANMQVSPEQASFLHMLIKIGNYSQVLEVGTFMGYSALAMALALNDNGKIITVDSDIKTTKHAVKFWKQANVLDKITLINEDGLKSLQKFKEEKFIFDFIFIDADKSGYRNYLELSLNLISDNGLIVFDNVLWKGKVVDPSINDKKTNDIREFNDFIKNDKRVDTTMISIGDGMTLCQKKKNLR
jgi:predicted O-methyltransferase YrrM